MTDGRRVRVMNPKTATAQARARARGRPADRPAGATDESTVEGTLITSLVRAQRLLAVGILMVMAVGLGALPALLTLWPSLGSFAVFGLPVPWLLLGILTFPALVGLAVVYVRAAERIEREFLAALDQS
jgi:hypothetical protein